ncbi:TetR/AcrR family transcriptional regulator [Pseudorhodoplanes sp.]|uniref:TetR/AcrR family transcriptional regulator n=1 Tax=Pseudorhodoplanes sp. TaxID=1934341 RepID=UPI003D123E96
MKKKRPYRMSERAKSQDETRQRIVEATMHLHEEIGPRATTISAIAERAGVQRLTVYRHFPDETAVFQACTSHWLSRNPPPDPALWQSVGEPWERLRTALPAFYRYYSSTQRMWVASFRDVADVPALQGPMSEFQRFVGMAAADLAGAFKSSDRPARRRLETTIGHAIIFPTWHDLQQRGLDDREKAALAESWARGTIQP